jgi:L-lactate dehydrogenase (cytochrome)
MAAPFDHRYPSVDDLRLAARRRIPGFVFDFLDGGCNEQVNLSRNTSELRDVELRPFYLRDRGPVSLDTELFGQTWGAPFGISPVGLQGLIWPGACEALARAATVRRLPFILSTCTTASLETIGGITAGKFWFQLYNPVDPAVREDLLSRAERAGCGVLVLLSDVPTFGYRHHDIRNQFAVPPRLTARTILQMILRPTWGTTMLRRGKPTLATLRPYMPANMDLRQLADFMDRTFTGRLTGDDLGRIRDRWKGKLVLKGVATAEDAEIAAARGLDGIIVSNHGGRQLDAGQSSIRALGDIVASVGTRMTVMLDSGIRSGPDIARAIASGARFTFLGRAFMYAAAALGDRGGDHAVEILSRQLLQVLEQLGCERVADLPRHLVPCRRAV